MTENRCQQCGENTYSGAGASSCTSCPDDMISAAGSTSEADCEYGNKLGIHLFFLIEPLLILNKALIENSLSDSVILILMLTYFSSMLGWKLHDREWMSTMRREHL